MTVIDINQLSMSSGGNGPPLLMVHAYGANKGAWAQLYPGLSDVFSYIAIDLPGSGASPAPTSYAYTLDNLADSLANFIAARQLHNLTIIAHSLGAAITLIAILRHTDLRTRVIRLILIAPVALIQHFPLFFQAVRVPLFGECITEVAPIRLQVNLILRLCYYDRSKITADQINNYARSLQSPNVRHALRQTARLIDLDELRIYIDQLHSLNLPCLLIWGENDRVIPPEQGKRLQEILPMSTLNIVKRCGHIPHEECAVEVISRIKTFMFS